MADLYSWIRRGTLKNHGTALLLREPDKPKVDYYPSTGRWRSQGVTYEGGLERFEAWYAQQRAPEPAPLRGPDTATLYTDGSQRYGSGAFAFWARSSAGRLVRGDVIAGCPNSFYAELYALYEGLLEVRENWPEVYLVHWRSDCQGALSLLASDAEPRPLYRELVAKIRALGFKVSGKWVKGHSSDDSTPTYLNRMCDQLARLAHRNGAR